MFSLNEYQRKELWTAFAQLADTGVSYIKGHLHVKVGGRWVDTTDWKLRDAELAFHLPINALSVHTTSLGGVGRCLDWELAHSTLMGLKQQGRYLTPDTVEVALNDSGFILSGVGQIKQILNVPFFNQEPAFILGMLDKPGFYTLIHPDHHPRLRRNLSPSQRADKLVKKGGLDTLRDPFIYVEAICALMEQSFKSFELLKDQVHALLACNNVSLQPANAQPLPETVEVWLPAVDPILKNAVNAFNIGEFSRAADIITTQLLYVYRPIQMPSLKQEREPLSNLLKPQIQTKTQGLSVSDVHPAFSSSIQKVLAFAPACQLKDQITTSNAFNLEEKTFLMERWNSLMHLATSASAEELKQANDMFIESISPWLFEKACRDFPLFEQYVITSFKNTAMPPWFFHQVQKQHPESNYENVVRGEWWGELNLICRVCDPRMQNILNKPFDAKIYEDVVSSIFQNPHAAMSWLSERKFLDIFPPPREKCVVDVLKELDDKPVNAPKQ